MPVGKNLEPEASSDLRPDKELPALDLATPQCLDHDVELQRARDATDVFNETKVSAFRSLGLLDRFLAVWIFLAMAIGIVLGNFVPNTGQVLQRGKFVGVSVPIGKAPILSLESHSVANLLYLACSCWPTRHDVPYAVQG